MEFNDVLKRRYSCRSYLNKEIHEKDIRHMLDNAIQAPNAGNLQPWRFIVVKNENKREEIANACLQQKWMTQAPLHIVIAGDLGYVKKHYGERGELYCIQDCTLAAGNILLTAASLKIDSCFVSAFDEDMLKRALDLPEHIKPYVVLTLGYSNLDVEEKKRYDINMVTSFEKFGDKQKSIFPLKN